MHLVYLGISFAYLVQSRISPSPLGIAIHSEWLRNHPKGPHGPPPPLGWGWGIRGNDFKANGLRPPPPPTLRTTNSNQEILMIGAPK